jgi:AcrR family transcriptional regulator
MSAAATPRQEDLLDRLVTVFLAEGFQRFTIAELAARLRCSKTTLYSVGHSKEAIVAGALVRFFRLAAIQVEERVDAESDPALRIVTYLRTVADALRPASPIFFADLAAHPSARAIYERNTELAVARVKRLIDEGETAGTFRAVNAAFVADVVTTTMARIQAGQVSGSTGLGDAEAYDELAGLILRGITS